MRIRDLLVASCVVLPIVSADTRADEATALLGNEYGELIYSRDVDINQLPDGRASLGLLMTEDNTTLAHGTLSAGVLPGARPLDVRIGARIYMVNLVEPDDDVLAIGFGASARYRLPLDWIPVLERFPFYIAASIYFAPEIVTSGSNTDVLDVHIIRGELELAPNMEALVGLRTLDIDRPIGQDDIVDEKLYVGLRFRF